MIKISEYKGFTINYDASARAFIGLNGEESTGGYESQEKLEKRIDTLTKVEFRRMPIVKSDYREGFKFGELTSVNFEDKSAWASFSGSREKINFTWSNSIYEVTPQNEKLVTEIEGKRKQVSSIEKEISELEGKFEKRVTLNSLKEANQGVTP